MKKKSSILTTFAVIALISSCTGSGSDSTTANGNELPEMPMNDKYENTLEYTWEKKKVLESKLLSDAETLNSWEFRGNFGELTLSSEKAHDGKSALMITSPTKGPSNPRGGRPWGVSGAFFKADGADWTEWNRISFWIYPDLPGFKVVSINTIFHNDGEDKVPAVKNGHNFQIIENQKWNKVYWEIEHLGREKVLGFVIQYRLQGNEPGATETAKYYIDNVCLEKVEPDHYEGWNVQQGEIAYNHAGYSIGFPKTAFIPDASVKTFSLIDTDTKAAVFEGQVEVQVSSIGTFHVADFTKFNSAGTYILEAGKLHSKPFIIDKFSSVYRSSIIKTINHFYTQRCGFAIEGIHDACHLDWLCIHGDQSVNVHGGWHDAGDVSQGFGNTNEATLAMAELAVKLKKSDPQLADRILEEARWGAAWVMKTRFGDGFRPGFSTKDMWTDDIIGNSDDFQSRANNSAGQNYAGAATEAAVYTAFKEKDKLFSDYALKCAIEDYDFAEAGDQSRMGVQQAGVALSSSLAMFEVTSDTKYKNNAIKHANYIVSCQQQTDLGSDVPIKGFFYSNPSKEIITHYDHRGQEHTIVMGLAKIAKMFPGEAVEWKKALQLYANYYKEISAHNAPYYMIPAGVYDLTTARNDEQREQIQKGIKLNDRYFIKRFPVWGEFRGNSGTILTQAKGLADVANYLNDKDLLNIVYFQLDWHLGKNPFAQSLIYGEGYRYAEQYTVMSGNLIGGMPVGVQTHFNRDEPYWPAENCHNWKEIWVLPSAIWLFLMDDFS